MYKDKQAGTLGETGYYHIYMNKTVYKAHRIVYLLVGDDLLDSSLVIDHIDRDKSNNKISNLRQVSRSTNSKNKIRLLTNTGEPNIHKSNNNFCVAWTENLRGKSLNFSFTDRPTVKSLNFSFTDRPTVKSLNHYPSEELAFEAAVLFRGMLVDSGFIILT